MPRDVGVGGEGASVRALLSRYAPRTLRGAGERMIAAELALAGGDDAAGMALGTAIGDWGEHGGYELEAAWDRACRRIARRAFSEVAERPADTLSGGERKALVAGGAFASDARVL